MRNYGKFLANLSLAKLWDLLANPRMLPVWLRAPRSSPVGEVVRFVYPELESEAIDALRMEFLRNHQFFQEINERMLARRSRRTNCDGWLEALYMIIRLQKPDAIVETGVFDGTSSAVFLQALRDNGKGRLISIDLPATETIAGSTHRMLETCLPPGCQPGWVIPDYLREQHTLLLGDSKVLLPRVLQEHGTIDVFLHDSLHTCEHRLFEYSTVWPHLSRGGLLLSDDIFWNPAFHRFCAQQGRPYAVHHSLGVTVKN
jgi:predicted O-methyltransferase YrrM